MSGKGSGAIQSDVETKRLENDSSKILKNDDFPKLSKPKDESKIPKPNIKKPNKHDRKNARNRSTKISRSVSLTPSNARKDESEDESDFDPSHTTPSPKPDVPGSSKNSVRARKEKFEASMEHRDVKAITKERSKQNKTSKENSENKTTAEKDHEKPEPEKMDVANLSENDKFTLLMEQMKKGFADMTKKFEHTNTSVDIINGRLDIIEKVNKKAEANNQKQFEDLKNEIENTRSVVTEEVIAKLQPQINQQKEDNLKDIRRIVQEEINLQHFKNNVKESKNGFKNHKSSKASKVKSPEGKLTEPLPQSSVSQPTTGDGPALPGSSSASDVPEVTEHEDDVLNVPSTSAYIPDETELSSDEEIITKTQTPETWAVKAGRKNRKVVQDSPPPIISFEKKTTKAYATYTEEVEDKFEDALSWLGIHMDIQDIRRCVYCDDKRESDQTLINADRFDKARRNAIKIKFEKYAHINQCQIDITSYYFTTKGGLIAWVRLDPLIVKEIHRRAVKSASKNFRTAHFIPAIARNRKTAADKILMDFKKLNPDFKYIIRNAKQDIQILIKRMSELQHTPYRELPINNLGALSPIKTRNKPERESPEDTENTLDNFEMIEKEMRPNYMTKPEIFKNINDFLDGFAVSENQVSW